MISGETVIYTCPMHPEVRQPNPGPCPKCGMALEPRTVTAEEEENPELADMTRRFRVSVVLTVPLVIIAMRHLIPGLSSLDHLVPEGLLKWLELIFAAPVVLWGSWPFFVRGWQSVITRNLNMFTLIALGVGVALGVPIAAGVLYPLTGILLSPIFAAAAMSFSSVSVIGNALRLRRARL